MNRLITIAALVSMGMSSLASATSYVTFGNDPATPLPVGGPAPAASQGSLVVFGDSASFFAAAPGVVTEDFQTNVGLPMTFNACNEPIDSNSNDGCFAPANLVPGFAVTSSSGGGLILLTTGFAGLGSDVVGANTFADTTFVDFSPPVTAVGMDVFAGLAAGDVQLTYFDGGGATIGSVTLPAIPALPGSAYVGVTSATPIASIELNSMVDNGELIDNLSFGEAGPPPVVPALGTAGLLVLGLSLVLVAVFALQGKARR